MNPKNTTRFHLNRTHDRGCDHRYPGRGCFARLSRLHGQSESIRGHSRRFDLPHGHYRDHTIRARIAGRKRLGLRVFVFHQ